MTETDIQLDRIENMLTKILEIVKTDRLSIDIKWLTGPQVMKLLNLTKRGIGDLRRKNIFRVSSATGRNFLYYKSDVENYMFTNSGVSKRRQKS